MSSVTIDCLVTAAAELEAHGAPLQKGIKPVLLFHLLGAASAKDVRTRLAEQSLLPEISTSMAGQLVNNFGGFVEH